MRMMNAIMHTLMNAHSNAKFSAKLKTIIIIRRKIMSILFIWRSSQCVITDKTRRYIYFLQGCPRIVVFDFDGSMVLTNGGRSNSAYFIWKL